MDILGYCCCSCLVSQGIQRYPDLLREDVLLTGTKFRFMARQELQIRLETATGFLPTQQLEEGKLYPIKSDLLSPLSFRERLVNIIGTVLF